MHPHVIHVFPNEYSSQAKTMQSKLKESPVVGPRTGGANQGIPLMAWMIGVFGLCCVNIVERRQAMMLLASSPSLNDDDKYG